MQLAISHFSECSDGDLAASAEAVEQRALAGRSGARGRIVQECQMLTRGQVAFADLDAKRSLTSGGAHDFRWDDLLDQLRFAQALQPRRSQDDRIVFALFEFAQARINIAAQGMNVEIGPDSLELRLASQARRAHARFLRKIFDLRIKS